MNRSSSAFSTSRAMSSRGLSPEGAAFQTPRYMVWEGRNQFFCGGRCMSGPAVSPVFATSVFIIIPVVTGLATSNRAVDDALGNPVSTILNALLLVWCLAELWLTAMSDPGIIPRVDPLTRRKLGFFARRRPPERQFITASGARVKIMHCDTCEVFGPPGTEHCPLCNNCVLRFDHHCPWVGNCIGAKNYPHFFRFLLVVCVLDLLVCAASVGHLVMHFVNDTGLATELTAVVPILLIVYTVVGGSFTFGMAGYHIFLTIKGLTTYEHLFSQPAPDERRQRRACSQVLSYVCGPAPQGFVFPRKSVMAHSSHHKVGIAIDVRMHGGPTGSSYGDETDSDSDSDSSRSRSGPPTPYDDLPMDRSIRNGSPASDGGSGLDDNPVLDALARAHSFSDGESDGEAEASQRVRATMPADPSDGSAELPEATAEPDRPRGTGDGTASPAVAAVGTDDVGVAVDVGASAAAGEAALDGASEAARGDGLAAGEPSPLTTSAVELALDPSAQPAPSAVSAGDMGDTPGRDEGAAP